MAPTDDNGRARRVGAVIPVFAPGPALVPTVAATLDQVDLVALVVDEGFPERRSTLRIVEECEALGALVVRQGANTGIAAALNAGVARLDESLGTDDLVLTLDQDSRLSDEYVVRLATALPGSGRRGPGGRTVGLAAPETIPGIPMSPRRPSWLPRPMVEPIQSGLLIRRSLLDEVGGFDEGLFIDGVDTDFFLRCREAGIDCAVVAGARLEHTLGQPFVARVGPISVPVTVARPFRYYYIVRNTLLLLGRHGRGEPVWAVRTVVKLLRHLVLSTVLAPGRSRRLAMALRGCRDGVRGVTGPMPSGGR